MIFVLFIEGVKVEGPKLLKIRARPWRGHALKEFSFDETLKSHNVITIVSFSLEWTFVMVMKTFFGLGNQEIIQSIDDTKWGSEDSEYSSVLQETEDSIDSTSTYYDDISDDEERTEQVANEEQSRDDQFRNQHNDQFGGENTTHKNAKKVSKDTLRLESKTRHAKQQTEDSIDTSTYYDDVSDVEERTDEEAGEEQSHDDLLSRNARYGSIATNPHKNLISGDNAKNKNTKKVTKDALGLDNKKYVMKPLMPGLRQNAKKSNGGLPCTQTQPKRNYALNNRSIARNNSKLAEGRIEELCTVQVRRLKNKQASDKSVATQTIRVKKDKSKKDVKKDVLKNVEDELRDHNPTLSSARHYTILKQVGGGTAAPSLINRKKQRQAEYSMEDNLEATYTEFGEPKILKIQPYSPSTLREGVIVQIEASTVSFTDCLIRRNIATTFGPIALPMTPGVDCIGKIVYCGDLAEKRQGLQVGDRVCTLHPFLGGNSRFVTIPAKYVHPVPPSVDACQAACTVRSYLAAVQILYRAGGMHNKTLKKGHKVLVTGANGNLGRAVVELAKIAGAKVYASCRKQHKMFVRGELGADVWMSEDPSKWKENLSMDIIVDCVCFTGYKRSLLKALGPDGVKLVIAGEAMQERSQIKRQKEQFSKMIGEDEFGADEQGFCGIEIVRPVLTDKDIYQPERVSLFRRAHKAIHGMSTSPFSSKVVTYNVFDSIESRPDLMADDLSLLFDLLECEVLNPRVAMTVDFEHVPKAHKMIENGGLQGAIVLRP